MMYGEFENWLNMYGKKDITFSIGEVDFEG
jgi:hypothetical protein